MAKKKNIDTIKTPNGEMCVVSPMWDWCNRFRELFNADPEVEVGLEDELTNPTIKIVCKNQIKALCIDRITPKTKKFNEGTVTIKVEVANHFGGDNYIKDVVYEAFKGNPLFDYMYWWEDPENQTAPHCWVTLQPEAIFWPSSDLHNVWGDSFDLPSNIAREMLEPQTDFFHYDTRNPEREIPDTNVLMFNE